ncbi:MAG: hypothetical protein E7Z94_08690 [Actinomyces ruminicola]|nr:hypothetical protein [Actinomyces ruminicola]
MAMELTTQRKFKVDWRRVPEEVDLSRHVEIEQHYWTLGPSWTLRYRITKDQAGDSKETMTVKGRFEGGVQRQFAIELPDAVDEEAREARRLLRASAEQARVLKTRYFFNADDMSWRLDQFKDENEGLCILEVEGSDVGSVKMPGWCEREVTAERRYSNESLAIRPMSRWP